MQTTIAASYERVSTRVQAQEGYSLAHQRESLIGFAQSRGWELPEPLSFRDGVDEDASGKDWDLPALNAMLTAAKAGLFSVLITPTFDRFARSMEKALVLEGMLKRYGVRVVYLTHPEIEDTPHGRMTRHIFHAFAELDREQIIWRLNNGKRQKATEGKIVGSGWAPYGYRYTRETLPNGRKRVCGLEPDPATAPIAQRILHELKTRSSIEVIDALNGEGVPGPSGGPWNQKAIQRIASDPVYVGSWVYGKHGRRVSPETTDGIVVPVPALIGRAEWDTMRDAVERRKVARRGRLSRDDDPYLLRGMLDCGHCNGLLRSVPNGQTRYYGCLRHLPTLAHRHGRPQCEMPDVHAGDLEAELWDALSTTVLDPEYLSVGLEDARRKHASSDDLRRDRLAATDGEIKLARKRLDAITLRLIDAEIGSEASASLERTQDDIEKQIQKLVTDRAQLAAVRSEGLSEDEVLSIQTFANDVRAGLDRATTADRRRLYELLNVRGVVTVDPEGVLIGRKHRFRIDWTAAIPLRHSGSRLRNPLIQWMPPPALISSETSTSTHSTPASR